MFMIHLVPKARQFHGIMRYDARSEYPQNVTEYPIEYAPIRKNSIFPDHQSHTFHIRLKTLVLPADPTETG